MITKNIYFSSPFLELSLILTIGAQNVLV